MVYFSGLRYPLTDESEAQMDLKPGRRIGRLLVIGLRQNMNWFISRDEPAPMRGGSCRRNERETSERAAARRQIVGNSWTLDRRSFDQYWLGVYGAYTAPSTSRAGNLAAPTSNEHSRWRRLANYLEYFVTKNNVHSGSAQAPASVELYILGFLN